MGVIGCELVQIREVEAQSLSLKRVRVHGCAYCDAMWIMNDVLDTGRARECAAATGD